MKALLISIFIFLSLVFLGLYSHTLQQPTQLTSSADEQIPNADNGGNQAFLDEVTSSTGDWLANAELAVFNNEFIDPYNAPPAINTAVLGSTTAADGSEKWIEVDISDQKIYGWEGSRKVFEFAISSGRPGYDTVQGEFRVWRKVKSQRYRGGTPGTSSYYNLPNVPYSLFFHKGYAIHGAYWHNDFGITRRSSGCVNVSPENAGIIYEWAGPEIPEGQNAINSTEENPGIRIVVHE